LLIQTRRGFFIGPDNGVLALATSKVRGEVEFRRISNKRFLLEKVSDTFHGRDIFAPVAAHLANGVPSEEFGPKLGRIHVPVFAEITRKKEGFMGQIIHIDDFGNIITNFGQEELELMKIRDIVSVKLKNAKYELKVGKTYMDVERGKPLALYGSHGFLEIAVNQGSAAKMLKVEAGASIVLCCT
jgi:S-adenosylmethionine hydrolase